MERVVTVGLDIAKNIFHVHGVAQDGEVVLSRKLRRAKLEAFFSQLQPCVIGSEACSTSHPATNATSITSLHVACVP